MLIGERLGMTEHMIDCIETTESQFVDAIDERLKEACDLGYYDGLKQGWEEGADEAAKLWEAWWDDLKTSIQISGNIGVIGMVLREMERMELAYEVMEASPSSRPLDCSPPTSDDPADMLAKFRAELGLKAD